MAWTSGCSSPFFRAQYLSFMHHHKVLWWRLKVNLFLLCISREHSTGQKELAVEHWDLGVQGIPSVSGNTETSKELLMPSTTPHFLHLLLGKRLPVRSYLILWWFCPFLREELMSFVHNKDGEAVAWFRLISHTGRNLYRFEYSQWRYYIDNFSICVL